MPLDDDKLGQFLTGWIASLPREAARIVVRTTGEAPLSEFDLTDNGRELVGGLAADMLQDFANTQGRPLRAMLSAESAPTGKTRFVSRLRSLPLRVSPREEAAPRATHDASGEALAVLLKANESLQLHLRQVFELNNQSRAEMTSTMNAILETDRVRIKELAAEAASMRLLAEKAEGLANQAMAQATEVVNAAEAQQAQGGGGGGSDMRGMFVEMIMSLVKDKLGSEVFDAFKKAKEQAESVGEEPNTPPATEGTNGASETPGAS